MAEVRADNRPRSPLKEPPARTPGQSLQAHVQSVVDDKFLFWVFAPTFCTIIALLEWGRRLFNVPPQPIALTILAVLVIVIAVPQLFALRKYIGRLRQGIDGELAVGQMLETLRSRDYLVFHDIVEDDFNIDHAIIGPAGVFTIETKTYSKPARGRPVITYDGQQVLINGLPPSRDPVTQAQAQANHLRQVLEQSTGMKHVPMRPVVLYPGWFVEKQPKGVAVWVLNPEALGSFLDHEDVVLSQEQIKMLCFHLSQHVKSRSRVAQPIATKPTSVIANVIEFYFFRR